MSRGDEAAAQARVREVIQRVRERVRITKVICTRSRKDADGDVYVGLSGGFEAAWESSQDDSLQGGGDAEERGTASSLTFSEAKVAAYVLGMQVDVLAAQRVWAGKGGDPRELQREITRIEANYASLILDHLERS